MEKNELTVVVGPTAAGKTAKAIRLAETIEGELVSADSRQVYRGMNIGTAKSTYPHHLIDITDPDQELSLADWQQLAFNKIDEILARKRPAILVGGTMLYVDSVVLNYRIPDVPANESLRQELDQLSSSDLYARLLENDEAAIGFINTGAKRRMIRALEVMEATGEKFSDLRQRREPRYQVKMLGVFPGWKELEIKIQLRAKEMIDLGLLDETEQLMEKYGENLKLLETQNYREAKQVLAGVINEDKAVEEIVKNDMKLAKKQMKWWKNRTEIDWTTGV